MGQFCHLIYPHLPEGQRHSLLDIQPLLRLFLQHIAGQQGSLGNCVVLLKYFYVFISGVEMFSQSTHRNPLGSDDLVNCKSFLRVGLQTSLARKSTWKRSVLILIIETYFNQLLSVLGHIGPLRLGKLVLPRSYPLLHTRRNW